MLTIQIPDYGDLQLEHLVLDFNGTLACRGEVLAGVKEGLAALAEDLAIHVVTADTFGSAAAALVDLPCELTVLPVADQARAKLEFVQRLGAASVVCIGNGRNDRLMLRQAALGIAVILDEVAASATLQAADVVSTSIVAALELLREPRLLIATLRS